MTPVGAGGPILTLGSQASGESAHKIKGWWKNPSDVSSGFYPLALPKSDDASARHDKASSDESRDVRNGAKSDGIDDLPNDEKYGDVESHDAPEFDRCKIER